MQDTRTIHELIADHEPGTPLEYPFALDVEDDADPE